MTMKQLFLMFLCLLFFAGTGYSQMNTAIDGNARKADDRFTYWNNVEVAVPAFFAESWRDPKFRAALGVSDEYYQEILASERDARGSISEYPGYREAQQEYDDAIKALTGLRGAFGQIIPQDANAEALNRFNEAAGRLESMSLEFLAGANQRRTEAFDNALTPELKQKMREVPLAVVASGERPAFLPSAFAALNLTDAQWEQMERIKRELEPEFERHLEICADVTPIWFAKTFDAIQEARRATIDAELSDEDKQKVRQEIRRKILMEDTEYQRILNEVNFSARTFTTLFTARVKEILNDEQRRRFTELIDNPPLHVRIHLQRLREQRGESTRASEEGKSDSAGADKDVWIPGPNAWRPGDPIPPGAYRQERGTRDFPRQED